MLNTKCKNNNASDVLDMYKTYGSEIFATNLFRKIKTGFGLLENKYSNNGIEAVLNQQFKNTKFKDLIHPTLIVSYDIKNC